MLTVCVACVMSTRARPERRRGEPSGEAGSTADAAVPPITLSTWCSQAAMRMMSGESRSPAYSLRFGIANSYFRAVNFADSRFEYLKMEIGAVSTFEIEFCTKGKLAPNESECVENAPTTLQN